MNPGRRLKIDNAAFGHNCKCPRWCPAWVRTEQEPGELIDEQHNQKSWALTLGVIQKNSQVREWRSWMDGWKMGVAAAAALHMWHTNKGGKKKTKKGKKKQRVTVKTTYMRHRLFAFTWVLLVELLHLDFAEDLVCAEFALWFVIAAYDIKKVEDP